MKTGTHGATKQAVDQERLIARIDVPVNNALLRSDIPIFGVAGGKEFKEYRVEYGEGKNPTKWHLIDSSNTAQPTNAVGYAEMKMMQGDIDIRGNLATWNTGLKEWVHLPWHPADDPTDFNGTYTIRLVVVGKNGKTVEDRVTCEVGRVIAQCLPGTAISIDKKVTMHFPQHSIQSPFRVYTIKPVTTDVPEIPQGQELIGTAYTVREPGDRFMKAVTLRFDVGARTGSSKLGQLGLFSFNPGTHRWELLPTVQGAEPYTLEATIYRLPEKMAYFAVFASKINQAQSMSREQVARTAKVSAPANDEQPILAFDTFEKDAGEWAGRDREFGATITRDQTATPDKTYCLKITNEHFGGNFAATVRTTPLRADANPMVSFDYKVMPGAKTDFYVRVGQTWYNVGFTDDENDFKYKDVGISRIGRIEGIITDGQWHSASFDLDRMLAQKTGRRLVEEIVLADWDVTGYMKLDFGRNARGATVYIDNFKIRQGGQDRLASNDLHRELVVDDFKAPRATNLLGGPFDVFSNPGTYNCVMSLVQSRDSNRAANEQALSLKYDVTRRDSYAGLWSQLQGISLEDFDQLSMKVRVIAGSGKFTVGLKNSKMVEAKVPVNIYLSSPDHLGWQELIVPLAAFKDVGDFSSMAVLSISFTEAGRSAKGEIIVDEIKFQKGLNYIPIADFEQLETGKNRLAQKNWVFMRGAAAISANIDAFRASEPGGRSMRISYGGTIGLDLGGGDFSYAAWAAGLGGVDASGARYLKFKIKGQKGGEKPNLYLNDGTTRKCIDLEKYSPVTTQWQEVFIPLDAFAQQGIDLTHVEELQFVFEWEELSGTIYVDDIWFCKEKIAEKREVASERIRKR